jgi:hypothetical protein
LTLLFAQVAEIEATESSMSEWAHKGLPFYVCHVQVLCLLCNFGREWEGHGRTRKGCQHSMLGRGIAKLKYFVCYAIMRVGAVGSLLRHVNDSKNVLVSEPLNGLLV